MLRAPESRQVFRFVILNAGEAGVRDLTAAETGELMRGYLSMHAVPPFLSTALPSSQTS
jgi:hypothetical protein